MHQQQTPHLLMPTSRWASVVRKLRLSLILIAVIGLALIGSSSTMAQGNSTANAISASKQLLSQSITMPNVVALAAGGGIDTIDILPEYLQGFTCALTNDGRVKCWGGNDRGQLGDGTLHGTRYVPVQVNGLNSGVTSLVTGFYHSCAVMNGGAYRWGWNVEGQLGDGTATNRSAPVPVNGLGVGVVALAAGRTHTCALMNTGGVECWGSNSLGQLGDGTKTSRFTPAAVIGPTSGAVGVPVDVPWVAGFQGAAIPSSGGALTTAVLSNTQQAISPARPYTVTVQYTAADRKAAIEQTWALYRRAGDQWVKEASSVVDPVSHTVRASPDRLALWAVLGDTHWVYLPLMARSYQPATATLLTFDAANDTQPALSPDGQTVVFISDRAGQTDVFRAPVTGGQTTNLTQTPLAQEDTPVFSPDGSQIAFASNRSGDWDIYLMDADGGNVRRTIGYTGTDELHPFFTPDGASLLFSSNVISGNWDIYSATLDSASASWSRLTTNPALERFPSISADGQTIAFRSDHDGHIEIYVMGADGSHVRRITSESAFDGYPSIVPDGSGVVFTSQRSGLSQLYATNLSGAGLITLTAQSGWLADTPRLSRDSRQLIYAARSLAGTFDVYLRPYESPLTQIGARGAARMTGRCDWEAGTLALGLAHAYQATGDVDDLARLRNWINGCIPIKSGHIDQVNDGLLGYAALIAYQADHQPQQLAFAQQVADFFMNTAQRAPDGTLLHLPGQTLIWDDTLLGAVPFLIEMSKTSGNSLYLDEAITQTIQHADYLRDPGSGLYHHAAYMTGTLYAPAYWARGNGWIMLADVELLAAMPITHPRRATILNYLQQQAAALRPLQDASGLWHTVVNRPDFYRESSGTALIGYALRHGVRSGWLNAAQFASPADAALIGVWRITAADGSVGGVSGPTSPLIDEDGYNPIGTGELELYGQGASLLLASPIRP